MQSLNKLCPECNIMKPRDQYYKSGVGSRSISWKCKECFKRYVSDKKREKRPPKVNTKLERPENAEILAKIRQLYEQGYGFTYIYEQTGISVGTLSKIKKLGLIVKGRVRPVKTKIENNDAEPTTPPSTPIKENNEVAQ